MDILEVILLIVGIVIFIGSFYCRQADRTPVESTQMRQNRKSTV